VKRVSISEAKNRLSALLDRVRQGHSVVIEDRGVPVATLEPMAGRSVDPDGRIARLERQGVLRRPVGAASKTMLSIRPPRPRKGRKASDIVIDDRREAL
jgi:prevent-host-death family protein